MVFGTCFALTHKPIFLSNALNIGLQSQRCSSLHTHPFKFNNSNLASAPLLHQLRFRNSRLSALSNGGSDGNGGGSSDGNSGGGGDDRGDKWSFLSWYLALLGKFPVPIKAITSAILTLIGDLICQEWFSAVLANWQLWIPFQFFNFRFVPQQFQVRLAD